jgi:O-antigen/teichoic acid export membrane protein
MEPKIAINSVTDQNISQKTITGIGWASLAQLGKQGAQFIISIVLVRLLTPSDFGLMGMILVFTGFVGLFSELGFGAALIQRDHVNEQHYSSIFWINLIAGLILAIFSSTIAPVIANFYHEPRLVALTRLISLGFVILPIATIQIAILNRAMNFRLLAVIEITAVIIAGGTAIALASIGLGVWSLIWQSLISYIVTAIAVWIFTQWRPKFLLNRSSISDLFGFSSNLLGFNVLNYWVRNGDNLLIGKFIGSIELGIYSRAYSLMYLPISQVSNVFSRVMFPALSRTQNDKVRVKHIYLRTISMIALITFPMMLGLFITADHFVLALLGYQWKSVIPVLRILSLLGMVQSISTTVGWIYQSQGRTDWMLRWSIAAGIILITSFIVGIWIGSILAVATCYAIVSGIILLYPAFAISGKLINMKFSEVLKSVFPELMCAIIMASSVWILGFLLPTNWPDWIMLMVQVITGMIIYLSLIHSFKIPAYCDIKDLVFEQWKNKNHITHTR